MITRTVTLQSLWAAALLLVSAHSSWAQGNCTYNYNQSCASTGAAGAPQGATGWLTYYDAGPGDVIRTISSTFGSPIGAPNITSGPSYNAKYSIYDDPNNDCDPSDGVLLWCGNMPVQNPDTDTFLELPVPDIPVTGKFMVMISMAHLPGDTPAPEDNLGGPSMSWFVAKLAGGINHANLSANDVLSPFPHNWAVKVNCSPPGMFCQGFEVLPRNGEVLDCINNTIRATGPSPVGIDIQTGSAGAFTFDGRDITGLPGGNRLDVGFENTAGGGLWSSSTFQTGIFTTVDISSPLSGLFIVELFDQDQLIAATPPLSLPITLDIQGAMPRYWASADEFTIFPNTPADIVFNNTVHPNVSSFTCTRVAPTNNQIGLCTVSSTGLSIVDISDPLVYVAGLDLLAHGGNDAQLDVSQTGLTTHSLGTGPDNFIYAQDGRLAPNASTQELRLHWLLNGGLFVQDFYQLNMRGRIDGGDPQGVGFGRIERTGLNYRLSLGLPVPNARDLLLFLNNNQVGFLPGFSGVIDGVTAPPDWFGCVATVAGQSAPNPGGSGICAEWDSPIQLFIPGFGTTLVDAVCLRPSSYCIDEIIEAVVSTQVNEAFTSYSINDAVTQSLNLQGLNICDPAVPNSTGGPGRLLVSGSTLASANDITVCGTGLPRNQFGYVLASRTSGLVLMPGNSAGNLCLSGSIARFNNLVQSTGPAGCFWFTLNLQAIPTTPVRSVQPGDSWYFQIWTREVGGTSNFTQAVCVNFI